MSTSKEKMQEVLKFYIEAWREQNSQKLASLFTNDAWYRAKLFGVEEYHGTDQIRQYWEEHPVGSQKNPNPEVINVAYGDNFCLVEWKNTFTTLAGNKKETKGMLILEFEDGLIKELREHYISNRE